MKNSPANAVDTAYAQLRDRLVTFAVKPGERMNESELATDLAMSRAPIREALNRLIADGLVSFEPGRGFFARRLSVSEMADLYAVRLDLETGALRRVLKSAETARLEEFAAKWRSRLAEAEGTDLDALVAADEAFHLDLAAIDGNAPRLKMLQNVNDRIRYVRRVNLETDARRKSSFDEHARLIDAIVARQAEQAAATLATHLEQSADEMKLQVQSALARIYADEVA